ncbi:unnamed protein product [Acanthoscelides obtectus]|uniref:Uncharacterized protein n=1 Tax=Acanthoscelides obtectus TaxID=200917 RepID=A0A9P0QJ56_ACAOB|nr:unnamed protein product [Acanthoscelides obtectus]CAK1685237.1 hypothetical protein AOBTE_LOCUS35272 [Acanthoscelides obtectus]
MAGTGVPPINIEGTADWSSLSRMMNSKGIQFSKARTAGTSVKVFTNTPADYRQLVALLESIKRPFFTYQLKEDRMDQRVIRGLPREMSVNDIKEDLESQGIADAVVQQLTSGPQREATSAPSSSDEDARKACRDPEAGHAHGQLREEEKVFRAQPVLPLPAVRAHTAELAVSLNGALSVERTTTAPLQSVPAPPTGQRNAKCCLCGEGQHPPLQGM